MVVIVGTGGATTVVVGVGWVGAWPIVVERALHWLIMVASVGPFWMGLHPGRALRSIVSQGLAMSNLKGKEKSYIALR